MEEYLGIYRGNRGVSGIYRENRGVPGINRDNGGVPGIYMDNKKYRVYAGKIEEHLEYTWICRANERVPGIKWRSTRIIQG